MHDAATILVRALLVGFAGAIGTLLRAGCNSLALRLLGDGFPWGTLIVNIVGSFAFGAIVTLARGGSWRADHEVILLVGLLGGFSTYSSFAFQSVEMLSTGRAALAVAYVAASVLLGLGAAWAGMRLCG
jgi:CrcB protein